MEEKKTAESLGSVLDNMLCDRNWQCRLALNRVFIFWEEVVGREIAAFARPEVVKGDVLWVIVPDSMRMQQLHLEKVNLLDKMNQRLATESKNLVGSSKIPVMQDIRFKIGRVEQVEIVEKAKAQIPVVDPKREHEFDLLTRSIKDDELRDRIKRLWRGQEKRCIDRTQG